MGYVYQLTNKINGKRYIGHTTRSIDVRVSEHAKNSNKYNTHFYNALKKYGIENFEISELFYSQCDKTSLLKEIELIRETNSEYNIHLGGNGGDTFSNLTEERKLKIIEAKKYRYRKGTNRRIDSINRGRLAARKMRKLSNSDVIAIRASEESDTILSKKYGVSRKSIYRIRKRIYYKEVRG